MDYDYLYRLVYLEYPNRRPWLRHYLQIIDAHDTHTITTQYQRENHGSDAKAQEVVEKPKGFEENQWHNRREDNRHISPAQLGPACSSKMLQIRTQPCQESVKAQRWWRSPKVLEKTDGTTIVKTTAAYLQHDWGQTGREQAMSKECKSPEAPEEPKGFEENQWHDGCEDNHRVPLAQLGQHTQATFCRSEHSHIKRVQRLRGGGGAQRF
jgi:hypothetical protein